MVSCLPSWPAVCSEHLRNISTPVWRSGTRLLKAPGEEGILSPISLPWACFMSQTAPGVGERKWLGFAYSPIPENPKSYKKTSSR